MLILDVTQHTQPYGTADTSSVVEPVAGLNSLLLLQSHE